MYQKVNVSYFRKILNGLFDLEVTFRTSCQRFMTDQFRSCIPLETQLPLEQRIQRKGWKTLMEGTERNKSNYVSSNKDKWQKYHKSRGNKLTTDISDHAWRFTILYLTCKCYLYLSMYLHQDLTFMSEVAIQKCSIIQLFWKFLQNHCKAPVTDNFFWRSRPTILLKSYLFLRTAFYEWADFLLSQILK